MEKNLRLFLSEIRSGITPVIDTFFYTKKNVLSAINPHAVLLHKRLKDFVLRGKMIRGTLVCLANALFSQEILPAAYRAGAAMELFQSALLIHDDIMDRDELRRGEPSIYYSYVRDAEKEQTADHYHLGESMGLCAGDFSIFLGFDLLASLDLPEQYLSRVISLCAEEYASVGIAQMEDVYLGFTAEDASLDRILELYRYKTGRYTFGLPLCIGAVISGCSNQLIGDLMRLGELLGIIFQVKDDEIGLLSDASSAGKSIGIDVKENKKTLHRKFLLEDRRAAHLSSYFGAEDLSSAQLNEIREALVSLNIIDRIHVLVTDHAERAKKIIETLTQVPDEKKSYLYQLLDYNLTRSF
jgi:geranylgeranyl diphosphate synthase type I